MKNEEETLKLKQAHVWYSRIYNYLLGLGFTKTVADSNIYYLFDIYDLLILVLYVNDLILKGSSEKLIAWC